MVVVRDRRRERVGRRGRRGCIFGWASWMGGGWRLVGFFGFLMS